MCLLVGRSKLRRLNYTSWNPTVLELQAFTCSRGNPDKCRLTCIGCKSACRTRSAGYPCIWGKPWASCGFHHNVRTIKSPPSKSRFRPEVHQFDLGNYPRPRSLHSKNTVRHSRTNSQSDHSDAESRARSGR